MGIFNTGRSIDNIKNGQRIIILVYNKGRLIWSLGGGNENIQSCFYNGSWIDTYSWTDSTPWTD